MPLQNKSTEAAGGLNYFNFTTLNDTCVECTLTCNYCLEVFAPTQQYAKICLNGSIIACAGTTPYTTSSTTKPYRLFSGDKINTACGSVMFGYFF